MQEAVNYTKNLFHGSRNKKKFLEKESFWDKKSFFSGGITL